MGVRVLFAGGGTGGHLFPALAIADQVKQMRADAEVAFVGAAGRIESRVVPQRGYPFYPIRVVGFRRRRALANVLFPVHLLIALVQSWSLLRRLRPTVVVGTGGYVSGPPVFVATLLRVPTLLQEQNSYPGVTTRLLARRVHEVHIVYEQTRRYIHRQHGVVVSGNPIRGEIGRVAREKGMAFFGFDPGRLAVLVTGGSQGASSINRAMLGALPSLLQDGVQVVWLTGENDYEHIREAVRVMRNPGVERLLYLKPFLAEMEYAFAVSDAVVCRSGATTMAEIAMAGVPAILVPYPYAAADHQTHNARAVVEQGAAVLCNDAAVETELPGILQGMLSDRERLERMRTAARSLARPEAAHTLAEAVLRLATKHHD